MSFVKHDRVVSSFGNGTVLEELDVGHVVVAHDDGTVRSCPEPTLTLYVPPAPVPDPVPVPTPPPSSDSFKGLADGLSAHYRPFDPVLSPFNQKPSGRFLASSPTMIANLPWNGRLSNMTAIPDDPKDVQHPIFFARTSDPVYKIVCSGSSNGQSMRIPDNAKQAGGSDGHLQVVQPDGKAYGCWRVTKIDKTACTITCTYCYWQDYAGLGCVPAGTAKGAGNGGTTASYFDQDAGIVRARHLLDGRVEHALFVVVTALSNNPPFVWPAAKADQTTSKVLPSMGDRLVLDATESEIRAQTNVKPWEKTIQVGFAEFGGLIGDTGGNGVGVHAESKLSPGAEPTWREVIAREGIKYVSGYGFTLVFTSPLWSRLKVQAR